MMKIIQKVYSIVAIGQREKNFTKKSFYFYLSGFSSYLSRFLSGIILLRYLGVHDYGLLVLAISVVESINGFFHFRHHESVARFSIESISKGEKKETLDIIYAGYAVSLTVAVITYVFVYLSAPIFSSIFFHQPEGKTLLRIYGVALFLNSFTTVPCAVFLTFEKHALLNYLVAFLYIMRLFFPVILIPFKLRGVLTGYILSHCIIAVIFIVLSGKIVLERVGRHRFHPENILKTSRWMFPFMFHTFFSETLKTFSGYSTVLILGYFRTPVEVSYFSIAQSYAGISGFFVNAASPLAFSKLSQLWTDKKAKLFELALVKGRVYLFLVSFVVGILIALPAPLALPLLYGHHLERALPATYLMVLAFFYTNAHAWHRPFFLAIGRPQLSTFLNILYLSISIPATIYGTLSYGIIGTAFSSFICEAMLFPAISPWLLRQAKKAQTNSL